MKLQRVALIIFYDTAGRILLQNRAGISTYGEKWGYFGGHIEEGETPKEAAVREVREELGLTLGQHEFVGVIENERYGDKVERHIFLAPLPVPVSDLTVREGAGCILVDFERANQLKYYEKPGDNPTLKLVEPLVKARTGLKPAGEKESD